MVALPSASTPIEAGCGSRLTATVTVRFFASATRSSTRWIGLFAAEPLLERERPEVIEVVVEVESLTDDVGSTERVRVVFDRVVVSRNAVAIVANRKNTRIVGKSELHQSVQGPKRLAHDGIAGRAISEYR